MPFGPHSFASALLEESKLPDYTGRHLFTTKLRLTIFLSCWGLVLFFFPFVWNVAPYGPFIFNISFLVTAICYNNVLHGRALIGSFVFEVLADVISQTTIVYLLGGKTNHFFLIYVLYCLAAGTFYGLRMASIAAVLAIFCYAVLLFLLNQDVLPVLYYGSQVRSMFEPHFVPIFHLALLIIFLAIIVYGIKIANFFTKIKEKVLEERNQQLIALHKISSTIHKETYLDAVIQGVIQGVTQGLGYDVSLLALLSADGRRLSFHSPKDHPLKEAAFRQLGFPLESMSLSLEEGGYNAIRYAITHGEIVFRNELSELTNGIYPPIAKEMSLAIQNEMKWKKFIAIPLRSERRVLGALVGISRIPYVASSSVGILEHFATQAALAIESAHLFEELRQKNRALEELSRVKTEFLAVMTHELRTPLHAILGFSELLSDGAMGELLSDQANCLREIHNNARNLSELINSVLDLAKAEAGKMSVQCEEFNFKELAEQVVYALSPLFLEKRQKVDLRFPAEADFAIRADPGKLRQVLTNLLSNAIKFTPEGGEISLSATPYSEAELAEFDLPPYSGWERGGALYVEVADTGIGISAEDQAELFQPFKQVDTSFTRRYQGTGLGLALCKQLVSLHGGEIGVASEVGRGSKFFFWLPTSVA